MPGRRYLVKEEESVSMYLLKSKKTYFTFYFYSILIYLYLQEPMLISGTLRLNLDPFNEHVNEELWKV